MDNRKSFLDDLGASGAKAPFVVDRGHDGSIVITELSRHPVAAASAKLITAWEGLHTALAGDVESDPDAIFVLVEANDAFTAAANDYCAEIVRLKQEAFL